MSSRSNLRPDLRTGATRTRSVAKIGGSGGQSEHQVEDGAYGGIVPVVVTRVPSPEQQANQTLPGRACKVCGGPDTEEMIQCDVCNKWHHFACVGVTKEIEDNNWSCAVCDTVTRALQILSTSDKAPRQAETAKRSKSLNSVIPSDKQHTLQPPDGPSSKGAAKQSSQLKSIPDRSAKGTYSVLSHGSSRSSILKLELQKLEEERALEQIEAEKQRNYLNKKYDILRQLTNQSDMTSIAEGTERVNAWVEDVNGCGHSESLQLVSKLPPTLKLDWACYRMSVPRVNLATFGNFLYSLAEAASTVVFPITVADQKQTRSETRLPKKGNAFLNAHLETQPEIDVSMPATSSNANAIDRPPAPIDRLNDGCPICKGSCRTADKCKQFLELSRDARWASVREFGLCRRCLRRHNGSCNTKECGQNGCTFKHHALLHNDQQRVQQITTVVASPNPNSGSSEPETSQGHGCNTHRTKTSAVLFRYLPVVLRNRDKTVQTYAFFDEGSELSLLDDGLAKLLELDGEISPLCLRWTGGKERNEDNSRIVSLEIGGIRNQTKMFNLNNVRTVQELLLPHQTIDMKELSQLYPHLRGLPVDSYQSAQPRILIGLKHAFIGLVLQSREGELNHLIASKTRLGWTVYGGCTEDAPNVVQCAFHEHHQSDNMDESLHQAMKEYFSLDSLGITKPSNILLSTDDQRAETLLRSLTKLKNGRYETGLLWRSDDARLPDNHAMALRRHRSLEIRLGKDPELAEILNKKIADYLEKGYIRLLTEEELNKPMFRVWYLPIFPVTNPNKPGKIRIVWDAAASTFGKSLNSALLKGPDQLCSLLSILLQFREHRVGLTGDIREMFHQVDIREEDQHCQRFFWTDKSGDVRTYVMRVMTFGACCSPSCAQYVKNVNAERHSQDYPDAAQAITKRHYVDDMLVSVETEQEAIQLASEVKLVHGNGGFEIRNWVSNSSQVLEALQGDNVTEKNLDLSSELATEKVLGMWWCTSTDTFTFKICRNRYDEGLLSGQRCPTKREILRVLMTIFDPLGLVAHFLMFLKILLQEVWRSGVQWDEPIQDVAFEKWKQWLQILPQVEQTSIPRCFRIHTSLDGSYDMQLHVFVDASENGFAAGAYLRFHKNDVVECTLVAAKTRVAPLKFKSIPKLELQAAVIGTRLAKMISESLTIPISSRIFWSDSRDVIYWINSDHRRYSQFVAFRVSEILETTEINDWRWVPTKHNVADDATKWVGWPDLSPDSRWFKGPDFLWRASSDWPRAPFNVSSTITELRPNLLAHFKVPEPIINVGDFSSWKRLLRVTTFVFRFPANCRRKLQKLPTVTSPLATVELVEAEAYLQRLAQIDSFREEIAILRKAQESQNEQTTPLPPKSVLYQLSPFLDARGVLRMRGRTRMCQYTTEDSKHPVVLPRDHHITTLIIAYYHEKYHHCNHETVINELRQKYCISRLRVCYGKIRRRCQRCKNESAIPRPPIMAELPPARLAAFTRPFTHVGIDYFGPF
ncbi:uncharacterized protein LOC134286045 [Aedes albopictus]|uniref:PHD-type domain-containing protein n=1 Tax=Aedes albopictus TaxID=7160 RepID=A0ABM1Y2P6_AEDAL